MTSHPLFAVILPAHGPPQRRVPPWPHVHTSCRLRRRRDVGRDSWNANRRPGVWRRLFVWSALLAVTLAALALGYLIGGIVADRASKQDLLSWVMLGAGVALALEPLLRAPTLSFADNLGLKVGPVFAALLLFFPTLCLLGMVGPIAIQRSVRALNVTGRRVGWVYSLSTLGSLVGTFAVGFYLIPTFSVNSLVCAASAVLLLFSVAPLFLAKQRFAAAGLFALLPAFISVPRPMPRGFALVDRSESLLGLVEVIDEKERNVRFLRMDHSVIGAQFIDTHAAGFAFQHIMQALRFARPEARTVLQIGLGAGTVPTALSQYGKIVDSVEIDPVIVSMAQKYFGFVANGDLAVQDARAFLRTTKKSYGAIIHDTFSGATSPDHLFSAEMLALLKSHLYPGGLLVLDFVGFATGPNIEATLAVRSTLLAQFAHVHAYRDSALDHSPGEVSNIVFLRSPPTQLLKAQSAKQPHVRFKFGKFLRTNL